MIKNPIITVPLTKIIYGLTTIYILLITVIVPLYHRDGFCLIGDRKYRLFFICSIVLIPLILLLLFVKHFSRREKVVFSVTDIFVIGYAGVVVISCMKSPYREIAIWGYDDWHMGTVTQLLLVGIYFAISRGWRWHLGIVKTFYAVSGIIFLLGVLNRFAIDPLHMLEGLEYWNKTHLLATIGNINWYSAYVCTVFPLGIYFFWAQLEKKKNWEKNMWGFLYCCVTFATLLTQGSESGIFTLFVVIVIFSYFSLESIDKYYRFLLINLILGGTACMMGLIYSLCDKQQIYFAVDLAIDKVLLHPFWWVYSGILVVLLIRYHRKKDVAFRKDFQPIWIYGMTVVSVLMIFVVIIHNKNEQIIPALNQITILNINKDWGSGRGLLWSIVGKAYKEMPLINKIVGVGADCFGPYLYEHHAQSLQGFLAEWWGNAIVANAHNEWLNVLINNGFLGIVTYIGIFITSIYRWIRSRGQAEVLIGLSICVAGYMIHNTVSFQQVVVTPIIFVILGMGEGVLRSEVNNAQNLKEI